MENEKDFEASLFFFDRLLCVSVVQDGPSRIYARQDLVFSLRVSRLFQYKYRKKKTELE